MTQSKLTCPCCKEHLYYVLVGGMGMSNYAVTYLVCNNKECDYFRILRYVSSNEEQFKNFINEVK